MKSVLIVVCLAALMAVGGDAPSAAVKSWPRAGDLGERVSDVAAGSAAVQALLVREYSGQVTVITLTGKRLPVPPRVRASPLGLSPDARLVAAVSDDAVRMGRVHGGSMKTVLRGNCDSPPCLYGSDPSYAWSPDSRRLAAAANPLRGATLLKIFNRDGRAIRSFALPAANPDQLGPAYHHLLAWSPDGSRLLLLRYNDFGPTAAVVLDVGTSRLRTLARLEFCHSPTLAWSPNGRFVALTASTVQDCEYIFSVIDAASARPIIHSGGAALMPGGTVWAPDNRSVFGVSTNNIDRYYLTGRRTKVISPSPGGTPHVALPSGLVYSQRAPKGTSILLYVQQFATGRRKLLLSSRSNIEAVQPLSRIP